MAVAVQKLETFELPEPEFRSLKTDHLDLIAKAKGEQQAVRDLAREMQRWDRDWHTEISRYRQELARVLDVVERVTLDGIPCNIESQRKKLRALRQQVRELETRTFLGMRRRLQSIRRHSAEAGNVAEQHASVIKDGIRELDDTLGSAERRLRTLDRVSSRSPASRFQVAMLYYLEAIQEVFGDIVEYEGFELKVIEESFFYNILHRLTKPVDVACLFELEARTHSLVERRDPSLVGMMVLSFKNYGDEPESTA